MIRRISPYHTIPDHTIPYHAMPYHTIPYSALSYHTIPYHTTPYSALSYHTTWHLLTIRLSSTEAMGRSSCHASGIQLSQHTTEVQHVKHQYSVNNVRSVGSQLCEAAFHQTTKTTPNKTPRENTQKKKQETTPYRPLRSE